MHGYKWPINCTRTRTASSPHDSPTRDGESTNPAVLADGFDSVHDESDVRSVSSDDTDVSMHSAVGLGSEPLPPITVEFEQPAPLGIVWSMHAVGGFLQMSIHALSPEFPGACRGSRASR